MSSEAFEQVFSANICPIFYPLMLLSVRLKCPQKVTCKDPGKSPDIKREKINPPLIIMQEFLKVKVSYQMNDTFMACSVLGKVVEK